MPLGREQYVLTAAPEGELHKVERRRIAIGSRRPGEVEVIDGLNEGDWVVTEGTLRVRPGQQVEVRAVDDGSRTLRELLQRESGTAQDKP
jgi:membrane fusion protein (multidrug efflux system)